MPQVDNLRAVSAVDEEPDARVTIFNAVSKGEGWWKMDLAMVTILMINKPARAKCPVVSEGKHACVGRLLLAKG